MSADGKRREPVLDVLRLAAMFQMVQGHALDAVLAPGLRHGAVFEAWRTTRGFTAVTFLFVSGLAFYFATFRGTTPHRGDPRRLRRRFARAGSLIALGYLLHLPVAGDWVGFMAVDILQCMGVALGAAELLSVLLPRREFVIAASAALGVALVAMEPAMREVALLPGALSSYVTGAHGSLFPLVPWAGFFLIGVALGATFDSARRVIALSIVAVAVLAWGTFSPTQPPITSFAIVVAIAAALCALRIPALPRWLERLAGESLVVYVVHILLVYGVPWGLGTLFAPGLDLPAALTVTVLVLAASAGVALLAPRVRSLRMRRTAEGAPLGVRGPT